MKKIAKTIGVVGAILSLSILYLSQSSLAYEPISGMGSGDGGGPSTNSNSSTTFDITAAVVSSISISATDVNIANIVPGTAGSGSSSINVKTNARNGFNVLLYGGRDNQNNPLISLVNEDSDEIAPNINAAAGTEGWYFKDDQGDKSILGEYGTPIWKYSPTTPDTEPVDMTESFEFTVGTSSSTNIGVYTKTLTLYAYGFDTTLAP